MHRMFVCNKQISDHLGARKRMFTSYHVSFSSCRLRVAKLILHCEYTERSLNPVSAMFAFRISFSKRHIYALVLTTFLCAIYISTPSFKAPSFGLPILHSCSPVDYSDGEWIYSPHTTKTNMTEREDALEFSGFSGCASSREFFWHLAADRDEQWDRFPGAQSWKWVPGKKCIGLRPLSAENLIKNMIEDGGWYLVGGESLCSLYLTTGPLTSLLRFCDGKPILFTLMYLTRTCHRDT